MADLLTVVEVAERLRVPKERVYTLISEGRIPAFRLSPRRIRVSSDELNRWLALHHTGEAHAPEHVA